MANGKTSPKVREHRRQVKTREWERDSRASLVLSCFVLGRAVGTGTLAWRAGTGFPASITHQSLLQSAVRVRALCQGGDSRASFLGFRLVLGWAVGAGALSRGTSAFLAARTGLVGGRGLGGASLACTLTRSALARLSTAV